MSRWTGRNIVLWQRSRSALCTNARFELGVVSVCGFFSFKCKTCRLTVELEEKVKMASKLKNIKKPKTKLNLRQKMCFKQLFLSFVGKKSGRLRQTYSTLKCHNLLNGEDWDLCLLRTLCQAIINLLLAKELLKLLKCPDGTELYHYVGHCFIAWHKLHNLPDSRELTANDESLSRLMSVFKIRI